MFKYQMSETGGYIAVSSVEFNTPLDAKDINSETIATATYNKGFTTAGYDPSIQEENADFANAMCDKIFGENAGATRFIVNKGYSVDPILKSEANGFVLIEISNNEIKQTQISIKKSSSNEEYLSKLNNQSNYRLIESSSYTISGEKLKTD